MPRPNPFEELRAKMLASAKQGIKEAYSSEEYALIQAINAYLETSKTYNLVYERLTEWHGIYFPEIRMNSAKSLTELTIATCKDKFTVEEINKIVGNEAMAKGIYEKAKSTIGRKMNDDERKAVLSFAELSTSMSNSMTLLEDYIKLAANRILPNVTYLTDEKIAAELLSKAGSMERLATMPASTVQLLGAEKSLFKHLKFGSKPPKYGVLFKLQAVSGAPHDQRGRIARIYATKISIALKADYYTKNDIAKQLKKSLDDAIARVKAAPPSEKRQPQQKPRQWQGQNQGQSQVQRQVRRQSGNQINRKDGR